MTEKSKTMKSVLYKCLFASFYSEKPLHDDTKTNKKILTRQIVVLFEAIELQKATFCSLG